MPHSLRTTNTHALKPINVDHCLGILCVTVTCLMASAIHHWTQCTYTDATDNETQLATLRKRRRLGQTDLALGRFGGKPVAQTCSDTSTEFVDNQILQIQHRLEHQLEDQHQLVHQLEELRSRLSEPATSANESNNVLGIPFSAPGESNGEIHLNSALEHGNR